MRYVTPKQAAKYLGLHPNTLARWEREGKIKAIKTEAGHRRYDLDAYLATITDTVRDTRTILYARVSTHSQKDDLNRQVEAISERYPGCEVITEVGSGLNFRRRKFLSLLERVIAGDVKMLVVAHKDRLARFGFDLVEWFCQKFGCELVVLYQQKHSPRVELVQDMLSVIHCFSSRLYGLRKYAHKFREDPELQAKNQAQSQEK
ncbi:DNA binding domain protein, excisionase family [Crinalium epipsammum PCC 9333]|uniref:DNA binding domain protein, excisionase family n=1 Tax=Crinalium epipsammum PCC 9333 TaxID=1173022 RepID=K9W1P1_9CYAN|nr:IS607 family transposase [Crinalium epipsammum]AFZ13714.1 DNA binding domain protein, excisionase family [Crinalium epipsammum PCC 9333]